jgi:hypothetical protein
MNGNEHMNATAKAADFITGTDRAAYDDLCQLAADDSWEPSTAQAALMRRVSAADHAKANPTYDMTDAQVALAEKNAAARKARAAKKLAAKLEQDEAAHRDATASVSPTTARRTPVKNERTTQADPATGENRTEHAGPVNQHADRAGQHIDHEAVVNAIVDAFQPLAHQMSRLDRANEIAVDRNYTGKKNDGTHWDLRQLGSLKSTLRIACQMIVSVAEGSPRFPVGTKAGKMQAAFDLNNCIKDDPGSAEEPRLGFMRMVADHSHDNIASPLAQAMEAVYEALIGEPLPRQTQAARPLSPDSKDKLREELKNW